MPELPDTSAASTPDVEAFIGKWKVSGGAERSNYAVFITELCDVLGMPPPDPSQEDNRENAYVIDRSIVRKKPDGTVTTVYADCYKRGTRQWDIMLVHASQPIWQ